MSETVTNATQRRGRPRKFDEATALNQAMGLFWDKGYRATTTRDLESKLGMSQPSIYNAFGSKQDLLLSAIDVYERKIEGDLFSILAAGDDGVAAIRSFFQALEGWLHETGGHGCLVVNLMTGEVADEAIDERVRAYRRKISDGFTFALKKSFDDDELVAGRASMLLSAVIGLHLTARTASSGEVGQIINGVCAEVAQWGTAD